MPGVVVAFVLVDQVGVEPIEEITKRVEELGARVGVDCWGWLEGGVDGLPLRGRAKGALGARELLVVDVDDRPSHISRVSRGYQGIKAHQPRVQSSRSCYAMSLCGSRSRPPGSSI